jgi:putative endonuclease
MTSTLLDFAMGVKTNPRKLTVIARREATKQSPGEERNIIQKHMKGFVYIMTNDNNSVLYTGVTSDLTDRVYKHKNKKYSGSFSAKYNIVKLLYFESCETIGDAIKREKQIKSGSRNKKVALINKMNPKWEDLMLILKEGWG